MESNGHCGHNWMIWTLRMTLHCCRTAINKCKKKTTLAGTSSHIGLNIHSEKSKMLKVNSTSTEPVILDWKPLEEVESFTYFGSVIDKQGGTMADVKARIGKARVAFIQLKRIWSSKEISKQTKIRLFNSVCAALRCRNMGGWQRQPSSRSRHLSIHVGVASSISTGQKRSETLTCGREHSTCQQKMK